MLVYHGLWKLASAFLVFGMVILYTSGESSVFGERGIYKMIGSAYRIKEKYDYSDFNIIMEEY